MSQNPEEPRDNSADDKDFESGLDYGAFVSQDPDYPEDHLSQESDEDHDDVSGPPATPSSEPSAAPPAGVPSPAATGPADGADEPTEVVSSPDAPPAGVPAPAGPSAPTQEDQATEVVSSPSAPEPGTAAAPAQDPQATEALPGPAADNSTTVLPREEQTAPGSRPAPDAAPAQESSPPPAMTVPPVAPGPVPPSEDELREEAEKSKRGVSRFFTVLIAIFTPLVFAVLALRMVASPLFLWFTYWRPGFPQDPGGWDLQERLLYGSYGTDFLFNAADSRYLAQLAPGGDPLFTDAEVSHMADVKFLIFYAVIIAAALGAVSLLFGLLLRRWRPGGFSRGMFAGAWATIGLIIAGVATPLVIGWNQFFTEFHNLFFPQGNWSFSSDSGLIRLYPAQFWVDAGIWLAVILLLLSLVTMMVTWPTKRRRARRAERLAEIHDRKHAKMEEELNQAAVMS